MKKYNILFSKQAKKDIEALTPKVRDNAKKKCRLIAENPYIGKPLLGDLKEFYSLRLTYKDRIVYSINKAESQVYRGALRADFKRLRRKRFPVAGCRWPLKEGS